MAPILSSLGFGSRGYGFIGAVATYSITPSASTINEGQSVTFTINTRLNTGVTLYWSLSGVTSSDISGGVTSGSFVTAGTNGNTSNTVNITTLVDTITDDETMTFELRTISTTGTVVGSSSVVINNVAPTYNVTPSTTSINEGGSVTFTITTALSVGVPLYWTLSGVTHTDITDGAIAGTFNTSGTNGNTSNTVVISTRIDTDTDTDSMVFELRTGDFFGSIVASSATVTINNVAASSGTFSYQFASATSNATTDQSPVNVYFRRNIFQTVYTAAELTANGATAGASFNNLRWYITGVVPTTNSARGLNIRLFHTTAADGATVATPISGESKTTVYSVSDVTDVTQFETLGNALFPFSNTFTWNGTNNICIESCTAQNETNYVASGAQRVFTTTNGSRFSRTDAAGTSCGDTPSSVQSFKPSVQMDYGPAAVVSATVTPTVSSVNEGGSVTFNVSTTNFTSGTLYWSLLGLVDGSDFSGGVTSGSFTVSTSAGSVALTIANDFTSEGNESFKFLVRSGSTSGTIIGSSSTVVINDTSLTPTATVTPTASSVNEGSSVTFNVATSGFTSGTLYYSIVGLSAADIVGGSTTGSFAITSSAGSVTVSLVDDLTTEGPETFHLQVRTISTSGTVIGTSSDVIVNDTSTTPTASVTPTTTSVNEGSSVTFNVSTSVSSGTLYWTLLTVSGTITSSDFSGGATSGSFAVSGNAGSVTLTLANDLTTEGTESFQFEVRTGSTSGTIIATSSTVTINDTSITTFPQIGYYAGGAGPFPSFYSTVDKLTYTTDTTSAIPASALSSARTNVRSEGNTSNGYFVGGQTAAAPAVSTVDRIAYSTDTRTFLPGSSFNSIQQHGSVGSITSGYFTGGYFGPASRVDRLSYSTETQSSIPATLTSGRYRLAGVGNYTQGYFSGGAPGPISAMDKLIYSTETISALPAGSFTPAVSLYSATGSSTAGYFTIPVFTSTGSKLTYSSELISSVPSFTPANAPSNAATSSSSSGYFGGGTASSAMEKLTFASETMTPIPAGVLSLARANLAAASPFSNYIYSPPAGSAGYFGGGFVSSTVSLIDKLIYSVDMTAPIPGTNLSVSRQNPGATGNTTAGYFGGGFNGSIEVSSTDKLTYSSDTLAVLPVAGFLSLARSSVSATGNSTAGYFGGGSGPGGTYSIMDKLIYSSDTLAALPVAGSLSVPRRNSGATGNSTQGYFGGGADPSPSTFSTMDKITYSTDTTAVVPGAPLSVPRRSSAATGNSTVGYFGGGTNSAFTLFSTMDKLTYSSDTITTLPITGSLSASRYGAAATGNSTAGYFGGGGIPAAVSRMDKVTYSSDTTSAVPGGRLSFNRYNLAASSPNANGL